MGALLITASAVGAAPIASEPVSPHAGSAGAPSADDRFYPTLGNGGYDVQRYDAQLEWHPPGDTLLTGSIEATVTIEAIATKDLSELSLDLTRVNTTIERVTVDDAQVVPGEDELGRKLLLSLTEPVAAGASFTIRIGYTATPWLVPRTGETAGETSASPADGRGLVADGDGGFFLAAQPNGAHTLLPSNDYPTDKAQFSVQLTVPPGMTAFATGRLVSVTPGLDGSLTWLYQSDHPVATHVLSVGAGRYWLGNAESPDGLPLRYAVPTITAALAGPVLRQVPDVLAWLEERLGRYPFEVFGIQAYTSSASDAILEAQTMVLMPDRIFSPLLPSCESLGSVAHEASHMWYGDSVSITSWDQKWLSEGHATYYEWLWRSQEGCPNADFSSRMASAYASAQAVRDTSGPPARPIAPADAYTDAIYGQGALALYALEQQVTEATFQEMERGLLARYADSNLSTAGFIDYASDVAGTDLGAFLVAWLCAPVVPPMPGHPDWSTGPPAGSPFPSNQAPARC
jgi:aminopeptidase N